MAPESTIAKYRGEYMAGWDQLREKRYQRQVESGLIRSQWMLEPRPMEIPAWDSLSRAQKIRYDDMMAIYAAMIDEIDQSIGLLVAGLEQRGQLENTLILFLSDNGGNAEAGIKGRYDGDTPGDPHSNVFVGKCWRILATHPFGNTSTITTRVALPALSLLTGLTESKFHPIMTAGSVHPPT